MEITPEPSAAEREALIAALAAGTQRTPSAYGSVWRLAGLLENVESDAVAPGGAAPEGAPRSSRGARRA